MTRISTTLTAVAKPDSVLFGELAIAAGLAGQPIAVCFSESPAAVDCELWKYFSVLARPARVLHVHCQKDVTELRKAVGHWRLIIVHAPRLLNTVAWTVMLHTSETSARPTIFSRAVPSTTDDVPIPVLVLRSDPDESSSAIRWLMAGCPQRAVLLDGPPTNGITFDLALISVTVPSILPNGRGPERIGDCQLLAAFLAGACMVGRFGRSPEASDSCTCGPNEYEQVRRLLQSPLVNIAEEPVDQTAVDMVNRANVYLELKCNSMLIADNPLLCDSADPLRRLSGSRTRKELVTRREIADLGNVRGRLIDQIVDLLRGVSDGHDAFRRMGLVRQPPQERDFQRSEARTLSTMLRPWSQKQVRTQFDALRKSGLITGERESGNAPWQYRLPEALNASVSPFAALPDADDLFSETGPAT